MLDSQPIVGSAAVYLPEKSNWFAVRVLARHEKRAETQLRKKGICTFLPLVHRVHRWSDRWKDVEVPLFSGYVFVRIGLTPDARMRVLQTPGVAGFVGPEGWGTPVPAEQIENIRAIINGNVPFGVCPFLPAGKRMRIRSGPLNGVEGVLAGSYGDQSVIVSVELLQRSLSIRVDGHEVEPIP